MPGKWKKISNTEANILPMIYTAKMSDLPWQSCQHSSAIMYSVNFGKSLFLLKFRIDFKEFMQFISLVNMAGTLEKHEVSSTTKTWYPRKLWMTNSFWLSFYTSIVLLPKLKGEILFYFGKNLAKLVNKTVQCLWDFFILS